MAQVDQDSITQERDHSAIAPPLRGHHVNRRAMLGGMAALGAGGLLGSSRTSAQDATPEATDDAGASESPTAPSRSTRAGETYQALVAQLAANLGQSDVTAVDTAIRDALKTLVEEQFAAGSISRNDADALISGIDTSVAPIHAGFRGGHGHRGRHDRDSKRQDTAEAGGSGADGSGTPAADATPAP